jgi:curli biogenesis system outer membrane secretion channel CsgG
MNTFMRVRNMNLTTLACAAMLAVCVSVPTQTAQLTPAAERISDELGRERSKHSD